MDRTVQTPDGRVLAVEEAGDPNGHPVLVHEGTPNSRHLSPQPGRSVADCAADVRAICAELGISRLAMWGISGGGPHVLASARWASRASASWSPRSSVPGSGPT